MKKGISAHSQQLDCLIVVLRSPNLGLVVFPARGTRGHERWIDGRDGDGCLHLLGVKPVSPCPVLGCRDRWRHGARTGVVARWRSTSIGTATYPACRSLLSMPNGLALSVPPDQFTARRAAR